MYVDVHTHLLSHYFDERELDTVLHNAQKAGVTVMINNGVDHETNLEVLSLAQQHETVKAALGLYPVKISEGAVDVEKELAFIEENKDDIIAIGEVGLDYKWVVDEEGRQKQRDAFRKILSLAKKIDKPVIIHSRKAEKDVIDILEEEGMKKVDMHCFTGNATQIQRAVALGFYFSIPTTVSGSFKSLVKRVPLKQILTETDAPYFSPFPDKKNEPSHIPEGVRRIAELKEITEEECKNVVFMNFQQLFI